MIKRIFTALWVLVICFGPAAAYAEALTSQQVTQFIASMPDLTALGEKHDDGKKRKIDPARPLTSSLDSMGRQSAAYADLAQLASRHGFTGAEQLADVGDRVMSAYMIARDGLSLDEVKAGYQRGVDNVNKDPKLDDRQKKAILGGMNKSHQRYLAARQAAEKDLPAVQPHMAELGKLFE